MAHGLDQAFTHCFPKSIKQFDMSFKLKICTSLANWFHGIQPITPWCMEWQNQEMQWIAQQQAKHYPKEGSSKFVNEEAKIFNGENEKNENRGHTLKGQTESCRVGRGPKIHKITFNTRQNSPIVQNYLKSVGEKTRTSSYFIHRSETRPDPTPLIAPTYHQIIVSSVKKSQDCYSEYKEKVHALKKERLLEQKKFVAELAQDKECMNVILGNPELVIY